MLFNPRPDFGTGSGGRSTTERVCRLNSARFRASDLAFWCALRRFFARLSRALPPSLGTVNTTYLYGNPFPVFVLLKYFVHVVSHSTVESELLRPK